MSVQLITKTEVTDVGEKRYNGTPDFVSGGVSVRNEKDGCGCGNPVRGRDNGRDYGRDNGRDYGRDNSRDYGRSGRNENGCGCGCGRNDNNGNNVNNGGDDNGCGMSCDELLSRLRELDFAIVDVTEYLNVYPKCTAAREKLARWRAERADIACRYVKKCGGLTVFDNGSWPDVLPWEYNCGCKDRK